MTNKVITNIASIKVSSRRVTYPDGIRRVDLSKRTFTTGDVAAICDVAPRTVAKWMDTGKLEGYRIPNSNDRRFMREDLINFMREIGMDLSSVREYIHKEIYIISPDSSFRSNLVDKLENISLKFAHDIFSAGGLLNIEDKRELYLISILDLALGANSCIPVATKAKEFGKLVLIGGEDTLSLNPDILSLNPDVVFIRPFYVDNLILSINTLLGEI